MCSCVSGREERAADPPELADDEGNKDVSDVSTISTSRSLENLERREMVDSWAKVLFRERTHSSSFMEPAKLKDVFKIHNNV